ncbi:hypothetical protein EMPS_04946 [Entomortierella parvispora]|uniref:Uncharacterized protein n=1 Tax=Entomortierella parvispora TaxID=205924 RepID=A0A9P3HA54_9FUNG|nr:hypothetical protein EMPS_04946 [Entomortierella parvispora]
MSPTSSLPSPTTTGSTKNSGRMLSRFTKMAALACLATLGCMPQPGMADIYCTQKGSDTFRVGSTVKFGWNDTGAYPIDTFRLDLYCIENDKFMETITTLNATGSVSPQTWVVNQTIMTQASSCPSNQYRGQFDWNYTDPTTGVLASGSANCKAMLLVGPGVVPPVGGGGTVNPDPSEQPPDDPDTTGPIEITDKTKKVVIGVGCAVGALVLAGFVGFYYIRYSNKRAVQAQVSKKLREPLNSSPYGGAGAGGSSLAVGASGARYNELSSVTASVAGYSPVQPHQQAQQQLQMAELNSHRPYSDNDSGSNSSRPQTPIAAAHNSQFGHMSSSPSGASLSRPSSLLPSVAANQDRPTSLLTSSFTPPPEPRPNMTYQQRQQQEAEYEQQRLFQEHQFQQQQQQMQQQQQQNYTSYQY